MELRGSVGPMCGKTHRKGGKAYRYYVCNGGARWEGKGRHGASVVAGRVDGAVGVPIAALLATKQKSGR